MSGVSIEYGKYMLISIVCCVVCSLLFILIGKYVFKPDMSKLMALDTSKLDNDGSLVLNKVQKIVLCFLFALVIMLLIPSFLPKNIFPDPIPIGDWQHRDLYFLGGRDVLY